MLPATRRERSTTRIPSSGVLAFGSNSIRGIIACSLERATVVPDAGGPQGLKRESENPRVKPEGKAAAPATVRGETDFNVPLPSYVPGARRRDQAATREPGDRPASRLRACLGRGVPVRRG